MPFGHEINKAVDCGVRIYFIFLFFNFKQICHLDQWTVIWTCLTDCTLYAGFGRILSRIPGRPRYPWAAPAKVHFLKVWEKECGTQYLKLCCMCMHGG